MKKIMSGTILFIIVFLLWDGILFSYWRSTKAADTLTNADIINTAFICPFLVFAAILSIVLSVRGYKNRDTGAPEAITTSNEINTSSATAPQWLNVYQIGLQTAFGDESIDQIKPISSFQAADTDPVLQDHVGLRKVRSRRIKDLVQTEPSDTLSDCSVRTQAIVHMLLESLQAKLATISEEFHHSAVVSAVIPHAQQVTHHPAWQGMADTSMRASSDHILNDNKAHWTKLTLSVIILFAQHADLANIQAEINSAITALNIPPERLQVRYEAISSADEGLTQINRICTSLAQANSAELVLILGADSTVDQTEVETQSEGYIPTEAGFSMLLGNLSSQSIVASDFRPIARLFLPQMAQRVDSLQDMHRAEATALMQALDELGTRHQIEELELTPRKGKLISDNHLNSTQHQREMSRVFQKFELELNNIAYTGMVLERNNTIITGVTLAIAIQHLQLNPDQPYVPILCSAGEQIRAAWLIRQATQESETNSKAELALT